MKTYTAKSSALRAAKAAGIAKPILTEKDGRWSFSAAAAPKPKAAKLLGKRAQAEANAAAGKIPKAPDFSAPTHSRWRSKLAAVLAAVKAEDVALLKAMDIPSYSSSPKAINRYRALALTALEARAAK